MTDLIHGLTVEYTAPGHYRRVCPCGYKSAEWSTAVWPNPQPRPDDCPADPAVRSLCTLQFASGGLFDSEPVDGYAVHLVRSTNTGTPGPTLCGIDRFAPDAPGWSMGGGVSGPNITHTPCPGCRDAAQREFPGLPISGSVGAAQMRAALAAAEGSTR